MREQPPKLKGKTVVVYTRNRPLSNPAIVADCFFEMREGRLFLAGTSLPAQRGATEWIDGVRRAIAWDAIDEFLLFDTPDDYYEHSPEPGAEAVEPVPTLPMFEAPQSSDGFPVEPSGIHFEPETPLEIGTIVLSYSQGRWWRAEVVGFEDDDGVRLHYPGWDSKWDVTVPKTELQVDLSGSINADE